MQLLSADTHFRAKAEFAAIRETRRSIPIDRGRIHLPKKPVCVDFTRSDDRFGMFGRIVIDVLDRRIQTGHNPHCYAEAQILFSPIIFGCRTDLRHKSAGLRVAAHFDSCLGQLPDDPRHELCGDL